MADTAPTPPSSPTPFVGVEVALLTLDDRELSLALVHGALPGAEVTAGEQLDAAARRALTECVGIEAVVRQVRAFSRSDDNIADWVISIAYVAVLPIDAVRPLLGRGVTLVDMWDGVAVDVNGAPLALPNGCAEIVACALADLRAGLDTTTWSYGLLPEAFTLRALQRAHEAISGRSFHRMAFRKRLLDSGKLEATGRREEEVGYRPAELYRLKPEYARGR